MYKPFDTTIKQLLDERAEDWIPWLGSLVGLPTTVQADPIDTSQTSISIQADKVFKLRPPQRGILHLEAQASWDDEFLRRLLLYNVILWYHHQIPIYTVVLLLRRGANMPDVTGHLNLEHLPGVAWLDFHYRVVKLWELPASTFLKGGLGTLPLALLTDDSSHQIPAVMREMDQRLKQPGVSVAAASLIWQASYWLMGLRFDEVNINDWFKGVPGMEESTTYQFVLNKGKVEGKVEGIVLTRQDVVVEMLQHRFGNVPPNLVQQIRQQTDVNRLRDALLNIDHLKSIDEFQI